MSLNWLFFAVFLPLLNPAAGPSEHIRKISEVMNNGSEVFVRDEKIHCQQMLPEFYQKRFFELAWNPRNTNAYLEVLKDVADEGLNPEDYHFAAIQDFRKKAKGAVEEAELDLLLTDSYLLYASHFLNGKINPETVDSEWKAVRREGNARELLEEALAEKDIEWSLEKLAPDHSGYAGLKESLKTYRLMEESGGWLPIPTGETLKPGMVDSIRMPLVVDRLSVSEDLISKPVNVHIYGNEIQEAVRKFQRRHGLEEDGNLGARTLAAMNVSVNNRIDLIKVNLERYRWISQELGEHYVVVNIADFQMQVFKGSQMTYRQKVIVGKTFRKTPVFSSKMTYVVLNPYWTVPPTILFNDILPELQKNPAYLETKNIKVLSGSGSNANIVDPATIDWSKLSKTYFPYTLRQEPGVTNALGTVKFMFPNKYNVYMHDTPSRELFNKTERAFSSGCIRLNRPMDFAEYLLSENGKWDKARLEKALETGKEQTIMLSQPLNVHVLYLTAWTSNGELNFRKDLYSRDEAVLRALNEPAPNL